MKNKDEVQKKRLKTIYEKYGNDYFSKLGKKSNTALVGNTEYMRELAKKRWDKERLKEKLINERNKKWQEQNKED